MTKKSGYYRLALEKWAFSCTRYFYLLYCKKYRFLGTKIQFYLNLNLLHANFGEMCFLRCTCSFYLFYLLQKYEYYLGKLLVL